MSNPSQTDLSLFINQDRAPGIHTHSSQRSGYPANRTIASESMGIPLPAVTDTGVPVMIYHQEPIIENYIHLESLESIEF